MKILLCNDDGAFHKGLQTLYNFLKNKYEIIVCCPDKNWSSSGSAITIFNAIKLIKIKKNIYITNGTPVDACILGIDLFKPDAVISGINPHPTVGPDIFRSSTLAIALQSGFLGVPSAAISIYSKNIKTSFKKNGNKNDYLVACKVVDWLIQQNWFKNAVWNVNVHSEAKSIEDIVFTKCNVVDFGDRFVEIGDDCRKEKWFRITYKNRVEENYNKSFNSNGFVTDVFVLSKKKISLTPLTIDLTNYKELYRIRI
jgi:5'-nucleotidase